MGICQSTDNKSCHDGKRDGSNKAGGLLASSTDVKENTITITKVGTTPNVLKDHFNEHTTPHDPATGANVNGYTSGSSKSLDSSGHSIASQPKKINNISLDSSGHSNASQPNTLSGSSSNSSNLGHMRSLKQSSSVLGLDKIIDDRKNEGDLRKNIVHMEVPFGKPIEEVYDGVHEGKILGSGISGMVRLCTHKATGVKYAVKSLDLLLVESEQNRQQLREEIAIMCQLDHPNIVRLEEVYESHSEIYLVQELCVGGELFDRLDEQPEYHYTESECAGLVKQMICSLRYIHSKGIIHRDLKLENFLFSTKDTDSELKMIDFGLSKHFSYVGEVHHQPVGTPYTVSPEVIRGSYDERCDVWAIGVITYLLLSGEPPFGGCGGPESLMQVRSNILEGDFQFLPEDVWSNVSKQAKEFIHMCLVTDPSQRPTARVCQEDDWLLKWTYKNRNDDNNNLNPNVVKALVNFKEYSDMRKLLCEVLSFTLLPEQITGLRKEFEKLDTDGSGEISLHGLKEVMLQNAGTGSLGALTETEVEDIFDAMRVSKTETRIHWHEFIAAGLSQCQVDERNLKLAFERLDHDHKGYVTFDDVMNLMGRDGAEKEDAMKAMWGDSVDFCNSKNAQITYTDFLLLMKRQPKEEFTSSQYQTCSQPKTLDILHEGLSASESGESDGEGVSYAGSTYVTSLYGGSSIGDSNDKPQTQVTTLLSPPVYSSVDFVGALENFSGVSDGPLTMDDEDCDEAISKSADIAMKQKMTEARILNSAEIVDTGILQNTIEARILPSPPQSPSSLDSFSNITPTRKERTALLVTQKPQSIIKRLRSKSYDDQDINNGHTTHITRYSLPVSEHTHNELDSVINDETKTPLVVNRHLYRAHRQMRLAVFEASKRFEDKQMKRTKAALQAENDASVSLRFAPGLVMRHGHSKELSTEAIHTLMQEKQTQQQKMMEVANRRGGRGRRTRKKTISDMSGMLGSNPTDEFNTSLPSIPSCGPSNEYDTNLTSIPASPPTVIETVPLPVDPIAQDTPQFHLHDMSHREPTVPGVFRQTLDPFGRMNFPFMEEVGTLKRTTNKTSFDRLDSASRLKLSVSDGELNQHIEPGSPESIKVDLSESTSSIGASSSWPPPPPL